MTIHLKRTVFFFCILNFGLGCCLGNRANAVAEDPYYYRMFMTAIFLYYDPGNFREISGIVSCNGIGLEGVGIYGKNIPDIPIVVTDSQGYYEIKGTPGVGDTLTPKKDSFQFDPLFRTIPENKYHQLYQHFTAYKYTITGKVTYNGIGLEGVEILTNTLKVAETDSQGDYQAEVCSGNAFTLTPQLAGYTFTPASQPIPVNQYNQVNKDFTAQTAVTISGNVKWSNATGTPNAYTTPISNPLPMVTMQAWAEDGSLYYQTATDVDGNYSIPVPTGWNGWFKPSYIDGFEFWPEKMAKNSLTENNKYNFSAPRPTIVGGHIYKITVSLIDENGDTPFLSNHVDIQFDGINHAYGSYWKSTFSETGDYYIYWPSGWIGDIHKYVTEPGVT